MARIAAKRPAGAASQLINEPEPGVVPGPRIFGPGIAETDDQLERNT
jgi:hypothetical protein